MWLSLVERCVRDAEAAGSNPVISTRKTTAFGRGPLFLFVFLVLVFLCFWIVFHIRRSTVSAAPCGMAFD